MVSVVFASNAFVITNDSGACHGATPEPPATQKGVII